MSEFYFNKASLPILFIWYSVIGVAALIISILLLSKMDIFGSSQVNEIALVIFSAMLSGSMYYTIKLYKTCFSQESETLVSGTDFPKVCASVAYFLLRPLYSGVIGFIVYELYKIGMVVVVKSSGDVSENQVYIMAILGVISGFSTGSLLNSIILYSAKTSAKFVGNKVK